jgi:hypothetical protein
MAANPLVGTYDPKKVIITLGGVPIGGYADGTFVQVDPNSETWTRKVGADGEVARALSNDNTHTIQITLMQTSLSNIYLRTVMNADKLTGLGMLPLNIIDLSLGSPEEHFWPQAWVSTDPSTGRAKETTDVQWTIHTGQQAVALYSERYFVTMLCLAGGELF